MLVTSSKNFPDVVFTEMEKEVELLDKRIAEADKEIQVSFLSFFLLFPNFGELVRECINCYSRLL